MAARGIPKRRIWVLFDGEASSAVIRHWYDSEDDTIGDHAHTFVVGSVSEPINMVNRSKRIVVFGSTGFVGTAVVEALRLRAVTVVPMTTPRLPPARAKQAGDVLRRFTDEISSLSRQLHRADCVVNAAGIAEASSSDDDSLTAANAIVPGYLAMAAAMAHVPRFIHVSSAAVQGRAKILDSSTSIAPFSAYSRSKVLGEQLARRAHAGTVVYRPPGVHGPDRRVTRMTAHLARSPISSVARPGSSPSPQTLLQNAADAIAFLATTEVQPPAIVAHPSEGLTTSNVLALLGGRQPLEIPRALARVVVGMLTTCGRVIPQVAANARRVEMLWFGQPQAPSWLTEAGWSPPAGLEAWKELGRALADHPVEDDSYMTR